MSDPSNILSALQDAFKKLDKTALNSESENAASIPNPIPVTAILARIRTNDKTLRHDMVINSPFKNPANQVSESRMAARDGQEISSEILDKMQRNRKTSD